MHKVFTSYHHEKDQFYKEELLRLNNNYGNPIFMDKSVDTGDISEKLPDTEIREKIRDDYLRDSTVTILLLGTETKYRKHIDWELYSSMYNGKENKRSGILVINLPTIEHCFSIIAERGEEEKRLYSSNYSWCNISKRKEFEERYPHMPERIIDNLINPKAHISVTNWSEIVANPEILKSLIDLTYRDRTKCEYDLKRPMKRQNFDPHNFVSPNL